MGLIKKSGNCFLKNKICKILFGFKLKDCEKNIYK